MEIVLESLPYIWLIWTAVGFFIVLVGILMMAHDKSVSTKQKERVDYSFLSVLDKKTHVSKAPLPQEDKQEDSNNQHKHITDLYAKGYATHEIAKKLGVGVGEVELIVSLNKME